RRTGDERDHHTRGAGFDPAADRRARASPRSAACAAGPRRRCHGRSHGRDARRIRMTSPVAIGSILNLRDVGGLRTGDGRTVRPGLLFRSATPFFLTADDATLLTTELGIRTR